MCTSPDSRNGRTRHALLIERHGRTLLVDTPPELRLQLVAAEVRDIDSVFLSHPHADHIHGLDDLRIFSLRSRRPVPLFAAEEYESGIRQRFSYIWGPNAGPSEGTTIPELHLQTFRDREPFDANGFPLLPLAFPHGSYLSYGFRLDDVAVIVDAKVVPEAVFELLSGIRTLVINALWFGRPHPSHFNVEEAVEVAQRLGAERTFLTHLSHRLDHVDLQARLPDGVCPAFDGLEVEV